jgi:hypothetical protein
MVVSAAGNCVVLGCRMAGILFEGGLLKYILSVDIQTDKIIQSFFEVKRVI